MMTGGGFRRGNVTGGRVALILSNDGKGESQGSMYTPQNSQNCDAEEDTVSNINYCMLFMDHVNHILCKALYSFNMYHIMNTCVYVWQCHLLMYFGMNSTASLVSSNALSPPSSTQHLQGKQEI